MLSNQSQIPPLTLAVAQSIAVPNDVEHNVRRHVRLASVAAEQGARFILFPELSLTGYSLHLTTADALSAEDGRLSPLRNAAREGGIVIVAGGPLLSPDGLHIGALIFHPDGTAGTYLKEYLHGGEEVAFAPGSGGDPLLLEGEVIGHAICADITHPEHACAAAARGATVYAAGCFITETGYDIDTAILQRSAVEHRMMTMMANYGGPTPEFSSAGKSAVWSGAGELLACAPAAGEALCIAERFADGWRGRVMEEREVESTSGIFSRL